MVPEMGYHKWTMRANPYSVNWRLFCYAAEMELNCSVVVPSAASALIAGHSTAQVLLQKADLVSLMQGCC